MPSNDRLKADDIAGRCFQKVRTERYARAVGRFV